MKLWKKLVIAGISGSVLLILLLMLIPILSERSWWWVGGPTIFIIVVWVVVAITLLALKLTKRKPAEIKLNIKDAKVRAVHEMKLDENNPDNFKIDESILKRIGEKGSTPTPVLILNGMGTELNQKRTVIINLNNPKQESTHLIDASEDKVLEYSKAIAEHPPEEEFRKETASLDMFGRPVTTTVTRRPSSSEKKLEEEKKKAEEAEAI